MGNRRRERTRRRAEPRGFLGPVGPGVTVTLSDHAADEKYFRRCQHLDITVEEIVARIRVPNAGRPDRPDPDEPDDSIKFHRFVKLDGSTVKGRLFKAVCVTEEATSPPLPGRLHIVTLIDLG